MEHVIRQISATRGKSGIINRIVPVSLELNFCIS